MKRSVAGKLALALLATAAFLAAVAKTMDLETLGASIHGGDPWWLAGGGIATACTTLLRAGRLGILIDGRIDRTIGAVSITHNALTALLPMKLGEFALPLLLSRLGRLPVSGGLGVLVLLRTFDLLALGILGALAMSIALPEAGHRELGYSAMAAALGGVVAAIVLLLAWDRLASLLRDARLTQRSQLLARMLTAVTQTSRACATQCLALSLLVWMALFAAFYCFCRAIMLPVDLTMTATIGTAASLAFAFPISGIANVGPFQAAWVWMSTALGLDAVPALTASLLAHGAVVFVTALLAGIVAPPLLFRLRRTREGTQARPSA